ncbi:hypothetical protein PNA2_1324 [Pyrococcus sp. NA2]|uniref:ribbon-helix-helix protein, CopG family n=1 Tax=Pyrococcus sp. (strain NA2) TaxID=342949 RepID=UPI000209ADF3|nr:ribbon-helix-helix protein, CopG family [Pyrococcus sp. NA2]AEC52239.1 hypothetical protein PNA2_1324 [Pyrococcus sp. NA2]
MPRPRKYEYGPALLTISVSPEVAKEFERRRKELGMTRGEFLAWLLEKVSFAQREG